MKQIVRIIGGKYRGKKLHFPPIEGLRPTPDRIRETLFNWLMNDIHDAHCLDAFAGSGALGLEAFSRGASRVCFVEKNKIAWVQLQKNIADFKDPALKIICQDACEFLRHTRETFDLVFLDPPFVQNLWSSCIDILQTSEVLKHGGLLYVESPQALTLDAMYWDVLQQKSAGQVCYGLFRRK